MTLFAAKRRKGRRHRRVALLAVGEPASMLMKTSRRILSRQNNFNETEERRNSLSRPSLSRAVAASYT